MFGFFRRTAPAPVSVIADRAKPAAPIRKGRLVAGGALAALCCTVITGFEGLRTVAYRDPVGIPTACVGETRGIRMGMKFTKPECEAMLLRRLTDDFAPAMEACVTRTMSDNIYAAFLSLSYNIGSGGFCRSSVVRLYNAGEGRAACDAMLKWNRAGGVVFPGLTRRREAERAMCLRGL